MNVSVCGPPGNLSVSGRSFSNMNTSTDLPSSSPSNNPRNNSTNSGENNAAATSRVFADPVAYLASLGIEAQLIDVSAFPAAA